MTNPNPEDHFFAAGRETGIPSHIPLQVVRDLFGEAPFRGIMDIIDPDAYQTGLRHVDLEPGYRILEFDVWSDETGTVRRRVLRIEVGDQNGAQVIEKHEFELGADGFYVPVANTGGEVVDEKKE